MRLREKHMGILLSLIMALLVFATATVAIILSYKADLKEHRHHLISNVSDRAWIIRAMAKFDAEYSKDTPYGSAINTALSQIRVAHSEHLKHVDAEQSFEFTLAKINGNQIRFLIKPRFQEEEEEEEEEVPFGSKLAAPMQLALSGKTGTIIAPDYRGVEVLAAFTFIDEMDFGIVAKVDMEEVRAPFVQTASIVLMVAILGISLGTFIFLRVLNPMIARYKGAEGMIRAIFDNVSIPIVEIDSKGVVLEFNKAATAIFGHEKSEVLGKNITMLMPDSLRKQHQDALGRYSENQDWHQSSIIGQRVDMLGLHKDGHQFPLELAVSILQKEVGTSFVGVLRNMTEEKQAKTALIASEKQLQAIMKNAGAVIFLKDLKGRFLFVNRHFSELFQVDEEEVRGKTDFDLFPPDIAKKFQENDLKVLQAGHTMESEEIALHPDGTFHTYISIKFPLFGADRKVYAVCGIATDITERKEEGRKLYESQRLTQLILNSTGEGIYGVDSDGRCTFCNSAARKIFGYSVEDVIGCHIHDLVHHTRPGGREYLRTECPVHQSFRDKQGLHSEDEVMWRKDGTSFPVEYRAHPIIEDGQVVGTVVSFSDITQRKKMEEDLWSTKEAAEAANRAKSDFLAIISHEVRTPMNIIIGMTRLVLETKLSRRQRKYLKNAVKSSESLLLLLDGLLDIAKIEKGKMELEQDPFDLHKAVKNTVNMFKVQAKKKGLKLALHIDQALSICYRGDLLRFQQILRNILENAVKFTEKGNITVTVKPIDNGSILFSVADTGIGIPKDRQEAVLNTFSQADGSTTRRFGGTGLGTSIAKNLVKLMGGRLWLESADGEGTIFYFTIHLPVGNELELLGDAHSSEQSVRLDRHLKILVVDDQPNNLDLVKIHLKKRGDKGCFVQRGKDAIEAFETAIKKKKPFNIILMDVQIPEMDGLTATRVIRQKEKDYQIDPTPIIALTAGLTLGERTACKKAGMNDVAGKPIDFEELFGLISRHLPGRAEEVSVSLGDQSNEAKSFPPLEGIDIPSALRRFDNNWPVYEKALRSFANRYTGELKRLKSLIKEGDTETAQGITHSLRGVAANLGAKDLVKVATKLETTLKSGADMNDDMVNSVTQAFEAIEASVETLPIEKQEETGEAKKTMTENLAELKEVLAEIRKAIETQIPVQVKPCLKRLQEFELPPGLMGELRTSIAHYDFRQAKEVLSQITKIVQEDE